MTLSKIFSQIECHLMEDTQPSQALERLFAKPLPLEFDPRQRLKATKQNADVAEIALLGLCDRLGRLHTDLAAEEESVRRFLEKRGW